MIWFTLGINLEVVYLKIRFNAPSPGFVFRPQKMCNFSAGISMQDFSRILLPGRILARILKQIFFLGRILAEMCSGNFS